METGPLHYHFLLPTQFANCIVLQGIIHQILFYRHQKANPILKQQRWQPWWRNCGLNTPLPSPLWDASQLFTTRGHPQSIYIDTQGSIITHIYYISFVITIAKKQYSFSEVKLKRRISFEIQKLSCITNPFPPCNSRKCFPDQEDLPLYIWIFESLSQI